MAASLVLESICPPSEEFQHLRVATLWCCLRWPWESTVTTVFSGARVCGGGRGYYFRLNFACKRSHCFRASNGTLGFFFNTRWLMFCNLFSLFGIEIFWELNVTVWKRWASKHDGTPRQSLFEDLYFPFQILTYMNVFIEVPRNLMMLVSSGSGEISKRIINTALYCPLPKAWRYTCKPDAISCGCEYSLYCKRGRENTGVSLYRKKDSTVDALIETVNVDSHSRTHTHTHLSYLHTALWAKHTHTHTQRKTETEKQKHKNLWIFLYCSLIHWTHSLFPSC